MGCVTKAVRYNCDGNSDDAKMTNYLLLGCDEAGCKSTALWDDMTALPVR